MGLNQTQEKLTDIVKLLDEVILTVTDNLSVVDTYKNAEPDEKKALANQVLSVKFDLNAKHQELLLLMSHTEIDPSDKPSVELYNKIVIRANKLSDLTGANQPDIPHT